MSGVVEHFLNLLSFLSQSKLSVSGYSAIRWIGISVSWGGAKWDEFHYLFVFLVYTIPELEDENISGLSSREGIYHAREFERKPLHGQSIPPLIPQEDSYKKSQRKTTKEDEGSKTLISYYPDSKTATSSYSAIVTLENFPTEAPPTVADKSDDASPQQPLTPVRTAPPPPPERSKENAINVNEFDTHFNE